MAYDLDKAYDAYWSRRDELDEGNTIPLTVAGRLQHVKSGLRAAIESALEDEGVRMVAGGLRIRDDASVPEGMFVINGHLYRPVDVVVGHFLHRLLGDEWMISTAFWNAGDGWHVEVENVDKEWDPEDGGIFRSGEADAESFESAVVLAVKQARG